MGLTGREIAEVIWLASQQQGENIDIPVSPLETGSATAPEQPVTPPNGMSEPETSSPVAPDAPAPQDIMKNADIVPPTVEQLPSLALPSSYRPIPVPDAPAITQSLRMARALRPLARQIAAGLPTLLDEAATVQWVADTGVWQPVLKAEPELWLDVALVFDTSPSMCLWQRFGVDLHRLLARYGEFRDVRIWRLAHEASGVTLTSRRGVTRKPSELLTGDRRRLVVIVSDCVAPAWHNGQMHDLISIWAAKLPTVVFQVFPERLWARTALVRSVGVELKGQQPGLPSNQLQPFARSVWDQERLRQSLTEPQVHIPVVTVEQEALSSWARMVAGDRQARSLGIVWDAAPATIPVSAPNTVNVPSVQDRLERFILNASPLALQLAGLLASAPVITLPIVRLIKQANLKQVSAVHIAEVFMSGLLKVSGDHRPTFDNAERIIYELVDEEVRDRLRAGSPVADALTVYRNVSEYVAQGLGKSVSEFWALLRVPSQGESAQATDFLNAFASITAKVLRGLGSEFDAIADSLTQVTPAAVPQNEDDWLADFPLEEIEYEVAEYINFPPLEPFDLIEAHFRDADAEFPPPLSIEEFTVITLEALKEPPKPAYNVPIVGFVFDFDTAGLVREGNNWRVRQQQGHAQGYLEQLGNGIHIFMVAIPGGHFVMGSPDSENSRFEREGPRHEVQISSFFMGRFPIDQAQWRLVATMPRVEQDLNPNPSWFQGENRPVEKVSWQDATEFCARLSAHTNRLYRLPTEAEWEYACRAGTTTPFYFGDTIVTQIANYNGAVYLDEPPGERRDETTAIDHFGMANAFGLSDMHGNVWEWCQDHWHANYENAPTNGSAWVEGGNADVRVLRGGSWDDRPAYCRSAFRVNDYPVFRSDDIGFRVVCASKIQE